MVFSHISSYLPKYAEYFNGPTVDSCLNKMISAKKGGKVMLKFFKKAVEKDQWGSDVAFRSLLDGCVRNISKLDKKQREKFTKPHKVFNEKAAHFAKKQEKAKKKEEEPKPEGFQYHYYRGSSSSGFNDFFRNFGGYNYFFNTKETAPPKEKPQLTVEQEAHLEKMQLRVASSEKAAFTKLFERYRQEVDEPKTISSYEALQLFGTSDVKQAARVYKKLLMAIHPDRWSDERQVIPTAQKFTQFVKHYHDIAQL